MADLKRTTAADVAAKVARIDRDYMEATKRHHETLEREAEDAREVLRRGLPGVDALLERALAAGVVVFERTGETPYVMATLGGAQYGVIQGQALPDGVTRIAVLAFVVPL
jgi:hypothetical protein